MSKADAVGTILVHVGLLCIVAAAWINWGEAAGLVTVGLYLLITGAATQVDDDE